MIMTDVIEKIVEGYEDYEPEHDATFLWLTDQPELNEQAKRKMQIASSVLGSARLITIDSSFDQEVMNDGCVYFLNTQKLGREKSLVEKGDERTYTIWETISNTIKRKPDKLYLIIDEAHRGMRESDRDREQARTIVQKFIKGSAGQIPAVPLVIGISATSDRFRVMLEGTTRVARPIDVDAAAVRESGLIKDYVRFNVPREEVPSDITLLKRAAERWQAYRSEWATYCSGEGLPIVAPILVVQVEDAAAGRVSKTDLAEAITAIDGVVGRLPQEAYAQAFQEGVAVPISEGRRLRYLAPSEKNDETNLKVIFLKTNLSTGWDCPRAEVMMSFRKAIDATLIAQLVGRMVRTPLARRIDKNEMLNGVTLMLPHYKAAELKRVVERLKAADPDSMPPTEFEPDDGIEDLHRAVGKESCFTGLGDLPSYVIPKRSRMTEVQRAMKLARLLEHDAIQCDAIEIARRHIIDVIDAEYERVKDQEAFKKALQRITKVEIEELEFKFGDDIEEIPTIFWTETSPENVEDLFSEAGRRITEGAHKLYWRHRAEVASPHDAKRETIALLGLPGVIEKVNVAVGDLVKQWLEEHRVKMKAQPEAERQGYDEIRKTAKDPQLTSLDMPFGIESRKSDSQWPKHIYVNQSNEFTASLNTWESMILSEELSREDVIGWFRNVPRK